MSIKNIEKYCKDRIASEFNSDPIYYQRLDVELEDLNKLEKVGQNKAEKLWSKFGKTTPVNTNKCGSLIVFLLGYSTVNPIVEDIRLVQDEMYTDSVPDIDTDFDPRVRDWAKKHMVEVFGVKNVCSIGTYQAYKTRAVILDVARVLGENLAEVSAVTKRIEPLKGIEDEEGVEQKVDQMGFDDLCDHYPELKEYFEAHPEVRRHAEILRNQVKNMGTHAGGVIISDLDLSDRIPVLYDKPSSENRMVISAWAESGSVSELSSVGLVKFDLLGLNNLPVISDCVGLIEKTHGIKLSRKDIPISDRESIYVGSKKDLVGMFQFENPVTKPICNAVKMESLDDVAAITSLIRPGPMDAEIDGVRMPMEYARRKHGGEYLCPGFIKDALSETYGIIIYQEQVMKISRVLAGFTASEANKLRKACITIDSEFISKSRGPITLGRMLEEGYRDDLFLQKGVGEKLVWGKIEDIWKTGKKRVRRTETSSGHFVDATRLHQFLTDDGWKAQQRLNEEDRIVCTRRLMWDGVDCLSRDFTIVIAGLLTEGYVPSNRNVATFVNYDSGFMNTFVDAFENEFGRDGGSLSLDGKVYRIKKEALTIIHSKMKRGLSEFKVIPDSMMGSTKSVMSDFLSFMLGAEGGVEKSGRFSYSSKSERMIRQVRMLLLRFDIRSVFYTKNNPKYGKFYYLSVDNYKEQKKLFGLSHLFPKFKKEELRNMLSITRDSQFTTDTIPKKIVKKMMNQYPNMGKIESGTLFTADISRERFARVAKRTGDKEWIEIADSDFWFDGYSGSDRVVSISKDVYDFRVDDNYNPNMVVNGVVVHNCGKKIVSLMASIREKFISGSKPRIDAGEITLDEVKDIWGQIETFAGYGFNRSLIIGTKIEVCGVGSKEIQEIKAGENVWCFNGCDIEQTEVVALHNHGMLQAFEVEFDDGSIEICSINHKFLTHFGQKPLHEILKLELGVISYEIKRELEMRGLRGIASNEGDALQSRSGMTGMEEIEVIPLSDGEQKEGTYWNSSIGVGEAKTYGNGKESFFRCEGEGDKSEDDGTPEQDGEISQEVIRNGDKDICSFGHTRTKGETLGEMERRKSRKVCFDNGEGSSCGKEVKVGDMAMEQCDGGERIFTKEEDSLQWENTKGSGLCKGEYLGGSGRMLALRRRVHIHEKSMSGCSREGLDVECGGRETRGDTYKTGTELLEGEREIQTETRMENIVDGVAGQSKTGSISVRRVLHARCVGLRQMYDLEVRHPSHNFVLTSGIVTSNSHAVAYGAITTMEMWLKYHYRTEFLAALLNNTKQGKKKLGSTNIFADYLSYARRQDIVVKNPDVNTSKVGFTVENREICFALGHIKNVAKAAEYIEKYQPYTSMSDFYERVKMGVIEDPVEPEESVDGVSDTEEELVEFEAKPVEVLKKKKSAGRRPTCRVMESLIAAGAFSSFGTKNEVLTEYYKLRKAKELPEDKTEEQWQELEAEILGVCLSKPVLYKQYLEKITQEKWYLINEIPDNKKKVMVFCKIEKIAQHISKAGNSMHLVTISDGLDSIVIFVFQGGWETFKNNYNEGTIGAIPLSKFDDTESNTRFFDDRGKFEIIKKG